MIKKLSSSALLLIALCSFFAPLQAAAAPAKQAPAAGGISISPFLQQININPQDVQKTFNLTVTNHTSLSQEIDLTSKDFGSLNDSGGVLLGGSDTYSQKYGLASWITFEKNALILNAGESGTVLVTIDNRLDLQPGGHYGAVVASVANDNSNAPNEKVLLNQQLLSLILVDKTGGEHFDLKLESFEQNGNWLHLPNSVRLHFKNPGNVHVVPRGTVVLKSPSGTVVAKGIINSESAYILPQTFRQLYVPLTPVGRALPLPGLYHVEVSYRYDGLAKSAVKSQPVQFIDLGLYLLGAAIIAGIIIVFGRHQKRAKKTAKKSSITE